MKLNRRQSCALMLVFLCVGLTVLGGLLQALNIVPDRAERTQTAEGSLPTQIAAANATRSSELTATADSRPATLSPTETYEPTLTIEPSETPTLQISETETPTFVFLPTNTDQLLIGIASTSVPLITPTLSPGLYCIVDNEPVRARACQRGNCDVVTEFLPGQQIMVNATGQDASSWGNILRVDFNGDNVYIYDDQAAPCDGEVIPTTASLATTITPMANVTYFAGSNGANLRSCAGANCDLIFTLAAGGSLIVNGSLTGEEVNTGNRLWFRTTYNGREAYVYSGVVTLSAPAQNQSTGGGQQPISTAPVSSGATCPGRFTCSSGLLTCEQAYACLAAGNGSLDNDNDGVPCESICPGG